MAMPGLWVLLGQPMDFGGHVGWHGILALYLVVRRGLCRLKRQIVVGFSCFTKIAVFVTAYPFIGSCAVRVICTQYHLCNTIDGYYYSNGGKEDMVGGQIFPGGGQIFQVVGNSDEGQLQLSSQWANFARQWLKHDQQWATEQMGGYDLATVAKTVQFVNNTSQIKAKILSPHQKKHNFQDLGRLDYSWGGQKMFTCGRKMFW